MSEVEYDARLAGALDQILPPSGDRGDWERVLAEARPRRWRPSGRTRLALALAALTLAAVIPLTAVAASDGWWFFGNATSSTLPSAVGGVVVVESGNWQGVPWALTAYRTASSGICIAFTPNPPTGSESGTSAQTPSSAASTPLIGCGADVRGIPNLGNAGPMHEFAFFTSTSSASDGAKFNAVAGPAAADVASVEIDRSNGPPIVAQTLAAPDQLGIPIRFFVAQLPLGDTVQALVARDSGGKTLATITATQAPTPPGQGTTNPSNTGTVSWGS